MRSRGGGQCWCDTHITHTPHILSDEELGGTLGMQMFCKTERLKKLNVGFSLDEGLANPTDAVSVYYGERSPHCE